MPQWLIHLNDGKTLTDADCYPHEVEVLEKLGYSPESLTSVERVINGRHLTIKKSPLIDSFFVGTEVARDMRMTKGPQPPAVITKRLLGCYLLNSDPIVQVRLNMDPRNFDVDLKFLEIVRKTKRGINAKLFNPPKKGSIQLAWQKEVLENTYSVHKSNVIDEVYGTPNGLTVILNNPKLKAELLIRNQNVLLGFTEINEKLKIL